MAKATGLVRGVAGTGAELLLLFHTHTVQDRRSKNRGDFVLEMRRARRPVILGLRGSGT